MAQSVALDQWRGLALLLVLVSHGFYFTDRVHGAGRVGVNLFFFISGLLVYRSLERRTGLGFLWRRLKRLYPALLAYVALMLPIGILFDEGYVDSMPAALLYAMDYQTAEAPRSLGHLWSIACEMQFYALAPLIFLLGGRLQLVLLCGLITAGMLGPLLEDAPGAKYHFEIAVWPMMLGFCCERWKARLRKVPASLVRGALLVFAGGLCLMLFGVGTKTVVIATGTFALVPCLFAYLSGDELRGAPGRLLTWLGRRTYSIYLWQQPLTICGYLPAVLHPAGAVASALVGGLSFRWFERPFLTRRRRATAASPAVGETAYVRGALSAGIVAAFLALPAAAAAPEGRIVFMREIGQQSELFSIRADGSGLQRLTREPGWDRAPAWSPDGRLIASFGAAGVVIRRADGSVVQRIAIPVEGSYEELRWSPDGRWLSYLVEHCSYEDPRGYVVPPCADLWVVRPDGSEGRRLLDREVDVEEGGSYSWSPGSQRLVYEALSSGPSSLAVVELASGRWARIPRTQGAADPVWAPRREIGFVLRRGLFTVRGDGRGLHRLALGGGRLSRPAWSPDARRVAYLSDERPRVGTRWGVWVARADGRGRRRIGAASEDRTLVWSPSSRRLVWENAAQRLIVARVDRPGSARFLTRGSEPAWR